MAVEVAFGVDGGSGRGQPLLSHWLHVEFICSSKARCADPQDSVWTWSTAPWPLLLSVTIRPTA